MDHAGLFQLPVHHPAWITDDHEAPMQGLVDGDEQEVLAKYVNTLQDMSG